MSLMLRKSCQTVLDQYGISDLHAAINNQLKLSIVSECGKPFVTIQGVEFSRQIPTKLEIEYATELLDNFLSTHIDDIATFRRRSNIFRKLPTAPEEHEDDVFKLHGQTSHGSYKADLSVNWSNDYFTFSVNKSMELNFSFRSTLTNNKSIAEYMKIMRKVEYDKTQFTEAKKLLKKWQKYDEERVFLVKLKEKLSVCNI